MTGSTRALLGGGIGSGKSTAAAVFASLGAEVLSADAAAHAVLEPDGAAFGEVAGRWPSVVVGGRIDREALAAIVFSNPLAREALERVTHPAIGRLLAERVAPITRGVALVEMLRAELEAGVACPRAGGAEAPLRLVTADRDPVYAGACVAEGGPALQVLPALQA